VKNFGRERLHQLTGKPPAMTPSLPKIVWLIQNEGEVIPRTYKFLDAHAFLIYHLTGHFKTSLACADPIGLIDMRAGTWAADLIQELGLRLNQFPDLCPRAVIGHVTEGGSRKWAASRLPIIAGAGDGQCAGLGANAIGEAGLISTRHCGSGAFSAEYFADLAFRTLCAPIAGNYFLETVLRGGVFTVGWYVEKFASDLRGNPLGVIPEEMLEIAAAKVPPGCLGLMLVPYWNNVMNPYWDPAATGIMIGWTGAHGREHFYRAIMEGIAFEQKLAGDGVMAAMRQPFSEYVAMGGAVSKLWCQIVADVTGVPVLRSTTAEATCLGAGMLAAAAAGWYPSALEAARGMSATGDRFTPRPEMQTFYEKLYREIYQKIFPTLQPLVDHLTELAHGS
jgi:xylulokinase